MKTNPRRGVPMRVRVVSIVAMTSAVAVAVMVAPAVGAQGDIVLVSQAPGGADADGGSSWPSIAADGRLVAFVSSATNLVVGDTNEMEDVFVSNPETGVTTRVSVDSTGHDTEGPSYDPVISANGRHVAFASDAQDVVPDDTNGETDVFVRNLATGATTRVSVGSDGNQGNDNASSPAISADGRHVAFMTDSIDLVDGAVMGYNQVYVRDTATGVTELVSRNAADEEGNEASRAPSLSGDGRFVAFRSDASNLVPGDTNGVADVFVVDRKTDSIARVSIGSSGSQSNGSSHGVVSLNGAHVAFSSRATNLVIGDTNGHSDVFVHHIPSGVTTRISMDASGGQTNGDSFVASVSSNGRYVAMESDATDLVAGDTNSASDVFVHDVETGATRRVSLAADGSQGQGDSWLASLSANGRFVAYASDASNLVSGDNNGERDVFRYQVLPDPPPPPTTTTSTTTTVTVNENRFIDDDGSVFEDDIQALAAAGITRGCNPPVNDRFCPDDLVTRGQMAAFLVRGLLLSPSADDVFVDDGGSVFEADIEALAAAGITRGCNPPVNDRFCPDDLVTRGQMAAFLNRALLE